MSTKQLHDAILKRDTNEVLALIDQGHYDPDVTYRITDGLHIYNKSLLQLIFIYYDYYYSNLYMIIDALIKSSSFDPGYVFDSTTPLMIACENQNWDIALQLLATGKSNPHYANYRGICALSYAIGYCAYEVTYAILTNDFVNCGKVNFENSEFANCIDAYRSTIRNRSRYNIQEISKKLREIIAEM